MQPTGQQELTTVPLFGDGLWYELHLTFMLIIVDDGIWFGEATVEM